MTLKAFEIIDDLENSNLVKELKRLKEDIINDEEAKKLIDNFEKEKEIYEKYNYNKNFLAAKKALYDNEKIAAYIKLQNEINLIELKINRKINEIIKD